MAGGPAAIAKQFGEDPNNQSLANIALGQKVEAATPAGQAAAEKLKAQSLVDALSAKSDAKTIEDQQGATRMAELIAKGPNGRTTAENVELADKSKKYSYLTSPSPSELAKLTVGKESPKALYDQSVETLNMIDKLGSIADRLKQSGDAQRFTGSAQAFFNKYLPDVDMSQV